MFKKNYPLNKGVKPNGKSEEQMHYEHVLSFLKYGVSVISLMITILLSLGLAFTFNSVSDIRNELKEVKTEYKSVVKTYIDQISDLKKDADKTVAEIKSDSKDAVLSTKEYSENELSRISNSTKQIALQETQAQLKEQFQTDKIQNLIQNQATKEIKSKVLEIVSENTSNISDISDAASAMRIQRKEGQIRLSNYFAPGNNATDSLAAKKLYDKIYSDFYNAAVQEHRDSNIPPDDTGGFSSENIELMKNGFKPKGHADFDRLENWVLNIKESTELYAISQSIFRLSKILNKDWEIFDTDSVYDWFKRLK